MYFLHQLRARATITVLIIILFIFGSSTLLLLYQTTYAQTQRQPVHPVIVSHNDSRRKFVVEPIINLGFDFPTSMAFLAPNDILVLEKNEGTVKRVINGTILEKPLLDLNVVDSDGLLGIAVSKDNEGSGEHTYVFLYYTKAPEGYIGDVHQPQQQKVNSTFGYIRECNCLYRYELVNNSLIHPKLLLKLPAGPGGQHHGGKITIGPDNNIYVVVGDIEGYKSPTTRTKAQNYRDGKEPDGRSGILRITQDGKPVGNGILGNKYPLNLYYGYGIRNSFGMDFDPVTGNLWDTENGPSYGDEINLVKPGFNSGFKAVDGMPDEKKFNASSDLVDFNGTGKYRDPEFVWNKPVGPTAIKFLNSDKYGNEYQNDMFVGDINNGNLYHFDLNKNRTQLSLHGELKDKVADNPNEMLDGETIFGKDFGGITDMQVGPDGYLYVISYGSLFRIVPLK